MASAAVLKRLDRIGQGSITAAQGLLSLLVILRGAAASAASPTLPQLAVNAFLWNVYLKASQPAFFAEMVPQHADQAVQLALGGKAGAAPRSSRAAKPAGAADPASLREQVKGEVAAAIMQVLFFGTCGWPVPGARPAFFTSAPVVSPVKQHFMLAIGRFTAKEARP